LSFKLAQQCIIGDMLMMCFNCFDVTVQDEAAEEGYNVLPDVQRQQQQQATDTPGAAAAATAGSGSGSAGSSGSGGTSASGSGSSADDEVARVQAFLSAEQDMLSTQQQQQQQRELQAGLVCSFSALPRDLQIALISSPARMQLLKGAAAALAACSSSEGVAAGADDNCGEVVAGLAQLQQLLQELQVDSS
jgi:hypothetical protein